MKLIKYFILFSFLSDLAFSLEIESGTKHRDSNGFKSENKLRIWDFEDWAYEKNVLGYKSIVAYVGLTETAYVLSRELQLGRIDLGLKNYSGNWPLTRWQHEQIDELVTARYDLFEGKFLSPLGLSAAKPLGCMNNTPLRYGDIEEDGTSELVLILGNQLVVFSPDYEKTAFSIRMSLTGWYTKEETANFFDLYPWGKTVGTLPQYQNAIFPEQHKDPLPGLRGYAKIYQGDLDGDDHSDIIVWRKLYQSRMADDAIEGFELLSDTFYHYERDLDAQAESESGITGEYLPQATSENQIKSWLADNEFTWIKGYPSVSECEGEEGQLIPETHDALLNDPEVLK